MLDPGIVLLRQAPARITPDLLAPRNLVQVSHNYPDLAAVALTNILTP